MLGFGVIWLIVVLGAYGFVCLSVASVLGILVVCYVVVGLQDCFGDYGVVGWLVWFGGLFAGCGCDCRVAVVLLWCCWFGLDLVYLFNSLSCCGVWCCGFGFFVLFLVATSVCGYGCSGWGGLIVLGGLLGL